MAQLVEVDTKRCHPLSGHTTIGRAEACQIKLDDPMISGSHAAIEETPGGYQIRDLGSRRGTFLGAKKITEATLADGDELLIGPVRFRFEASVAPAGNDELTRLRAIVELGRAIGVEHDLERLLARVLETCFQLLRAERGALVIYEPHSKAPFMTVTRNRKGTDEFAVSTSVLGQVMVSHEPYLRTEIETDLVLRRSESLTARGVRSVMAVPLRYEAGETEWLGVIMLDSSALANVFARRDLELLEAIAGPTALAIKNAMLVRQVQTVTGDEWRRLERVVRDLQLGVIVLDDEDRCVLVNQWVSARAPELGALRPGAIVEAIAGVPCQRLLDEDVTHVTTASERLLAITASPSTNNRETVIVINDLTEERERQNQAAHRDRVALIGQLAGGVAHDFNNLLQVILTYSDMLEESATDPGTREDVQQITHAARSASDLTRQLLTFSRRELVEPTVVDVAHVVQGMEKLLHRMLGPQIQLAVSIAQRIPRILIDAAQLEQVLMNLVVNARDALAGKGRIEIAVRGNGRNVEIEVADDGPGIAPQTLARIFEPYFTTKPRGKGTGLGLATVHGIVLQARGDIAVESALGTGTRFRIVLPATDRVEERAAPVTASPVCEGTLLVVDDDDNVRRVTERLLRHAGYTILAASSGPEALAIARKHPEIDLLLTDIVMPGMSGRDLAQEISVLRPAMHVIFMSGYHQHAPISNTQFLAKPFTRTELLDRVQAVLANEVAACERGATLAPR